MRVVDAFTLLGTPAEYDLLEIRLHELADVVDTHILVESTLTFSGKPKVMTTLGRLREDRFRLFLGKIAVQQADLSGLPDAWQREYRQRSFIDQAVAQLQLDPHDWVLVSDIDEIPRGSTVAQLRTIPSQGGLGICGLCTPMYYYTVNAYHMPWCSIRAVQWRQYTTAQALRMHWPVDTTFANAGWHFSYLGGVADITTKLQSFAHTELDRPEIVNPAHIQSCLDRQAWLIPAEDRPDLTVVPLDATWPAYLLAHQDRFATHITPWEVPNAADAPARLDRD